MVLKIVLVPRVPSGPSINQEAVNAWPDLTSLGVFIKRMVTSFFVSGTDVAAEFTRPLLSVVEPDIL